MLLFCLDGDHPRFDFFCFRQSDCENTILKFSLCLIRDHSGRKRDRAFKRTPSMLTDVPRFILLFFLVLHLTFDGQHVTSDVNLYLISFDARKSSLHDNFIVGLVHVNRRRREGRPSVPDGERACERIVEQMIHCLTQGHHLTSGFPTRSEEHTSELQSRPHLVCRLLLEKKK